mmetsp:Transcript_46314/g.106926  ORF Transcript_46314/g.106926 Transcript_46314/m.106926 type:complete len:195 (-) Transcript_46314:64-648(-)
MLALRLLSVVACSAWALALPLPRKLVAVEEDWAWGYDGTHKAKMMPEAASAARADSATSQRGRLSQLLAAAGAQGAAARQREVTPSASQIVKTNRRHGCVTISSPLAHGSLVRDLSPDGTPCAFRADARDEAAHCMGTESGQYGQYGWCWTDLARTQWGSCSRECPLAGKPHTLGEKLNTLESLISQLSQATGA